MAVLDRDVALWGEEDAPLVRAGLDALFGHHPERSPQEREQAVYAIVKAVKKELQANG